MNIRISALVLLAGLSGGSLKADSLNYTVTTGIGAGQSLYQFTQISTISIQPRSAAVLRPKREPSTSFIEWTADFSGTHDVAIESVLTGFSLQPCSLLTARLPSR